MPFGNTYDTTSPGSGVGNREDLSDMVSILEPEQTPIYSLSPKETCKATNPEWTLDKLKTPSDLAGGVPEGDDVSAFSDQHSGKARIFNYIQKVQDTWKVSDIQEAVDAAGGGDATSAASAQAKAVRNVKRGVEYVINSDQDRQAEDGTGSPYLMRGLGDWIDSAGPSDVPSAYRTPSGSIDSNGASITEQQFNEVLRSIFRVTGEVGNLTCFASTHTRQRISEFSKLDGAATEQRYSVTEDATKKKITFSVNVFDSDFGFVKVVTSNPDCEQANDRAYILNMNYISIKSLIGMSSYRLEDQGGGQRGYVKCVESLCIKHPGAHGKIT